MEIVLHIGAHRTATTSFQAYMRGNAPGLAQGGVAFWGPLRTRNGLFSGLWAPVQPSPKAGAARVAGRVALALARVENSGARVLVISDENILGQPCAMLRDGRAYPHAAARAGALQRAFGGRIGAVVLGVRSPDMWWPSLVAMAVGRGHPMPDARACARMAAGSLDWAGLAQALHLAMGCPVGLLAHELCAHAPDRRLAAMLSMLPGAAVAPLALPSPPLDLHLNAAPRCTGFGPTHSAQLRSAYEAMLRHFAAASVGPVTLLNKTMPDVQGKTPAPGPIPRGQTHEHQGPVAQTG